MKTKLQKVCNENNTVAPIKTELDIFTIRMMEQKRGDRMKMDVLQARLQISL
jgi:hypothetical protein